MLGVALLIILLSVFDGHGATARYAPETSVIVVGAGMSGISAAKTLSEAGIKNLLILEATDWIGGRMCKTLFGGVNIEIGATWVEGVNGLEINPIWTLAKKIKLRTFFSSGSTNLSANVYQKANGLYDASVVQEAIERADNISKAAVKFSEGLLPSGFKDISILTFQRLQKHVPYTALDMVIDYYNHDGEFAKPPRVTSLQSTEPLPTFANFGEDLNQVSDQRGYESVVHELARRFLSFGANGTITDPRLKLNKVVRRIEYSRSGVVVEFEDGSTYKSDYVMVSASIGVLQSNLIKFEPDLPEWKILAIYEFSMAVYTKIYLRLPSRFWPSGDGTEFVLYASDRRGYYPAWQHMERHYPGYNLLVVTVSDEESRRIEQQPDSATKAEAMAVLRSMFGKSIPEATEIFVPRWWSNQFYRGAFSNWPIGVARYEFDQIRAPVGRVYFTGEHTSQYYNAHVHGAYLAGIDSALMWPVASNMSYANPNRSQGVIMRLQISLYRALPELWHFLRK